VFDGRTHDHRTVKCILTFIAAAAVTLTAHGAEAQADWPQFLGPARNGVADARPLPAGPAAGPKVLWEKQVGRGWSSPVAAGGKTLIFHRVKDREVLECLDSATGKELWRVESETAYQDQFNFDDGPRATPTISRDQVFTLGADGLLTCRKLADGAQVWAVDTRKEFQSDPGYFGMVCSPLVEGKAVIVNLGGKNKSGGAGIIAFDSATGKTLWQTGDHEAGYSSPIAATLDGKRRILSLTRTGLLSLAPESGATDWIYPFRSRTQASVNAATPLVSGDLIFITASYSTGAALLKWGEVKPQEVWRNDETLSSHYMTPVIAGEYLYGIDGRQEMGCSLRCVELKTGKVKWSKEGFGAGTLLLAGTELLVLSETGELIRVAASPEGYKETGRARILDAEVRASGALAGGLYLARDRKKLVCIDLR